MPAEPRPMIVLHRAAGVVELLAERGPLSVAQIAEAVGMPRPSAYRLCDALTQERLLEQTDDGKLKASLRWLRLADSASQGLTEWAGGRAVLDELAGHTGQTVYLSVPRGEGSMCIDWSRGRGVNVLLLRPGRALPLYAGAAGRVTLAFRSEPVDDYLQKAPFEPFTPWTLTRASQLRADVATIRKVGYSVSDEDVTPGIGALGVPLHDTDSTLRGVLSIAGLATELRDRRSDLTSTLLSSAAQLMGLS